MPVAVIASMLPAPSWAQSPKYIYVGGGGQWTDVRCAVKPAVDGDGRLEGGYFDASLGLARIGRISTHITGDYFGGETSGSKRETQCFRIGGGAGFAPIERLEIVGRVYYVDVEMDASTTASKLNETGYNVEGMLRYMASEKAEVTLSYDYTELDTIDNKDLQIGLNYNFTDMIAGTARGIVFDKDTGFSLGIRFYFGDTLFR